MNDDFMKQFYETAFNAGILVISDDKCVQLLAWLHVYGGSQEQAVMSGRLNASISYAQKRFNIFGGERPDPEFIRSFQDYVKTIEDYNNPPEWVLSLEKEYNIKKVKFR